MTDIIRATLALYAQFLLLVADSGNFYAFCAFGQNQQ